MNEDFYRPACLVNLFDWTKPLLDETNWLFVRLDSSDDVLAMGRNLSPHMSRENIIFWWREEGLWIPGGQLTKPFVQEEIVVPFSACYVFKNGVKECAKPHFRMTTDSERRFTGDEIKLATEEITKLGAIAYAADGCGLQWITSSEQFCKLIRHGYAGPPDAVRNQNKD